jgi:hypothetical protein
MYQLAVESLLGLRLEGDKLRLAPCLPANWPGFKLRYRYRDTVYRIAVAIDGSDKSSMTVDGVEQSDHAISPGRRSPGTSGRGHNPGARVGVTQRKALRWQGLHNLLISNTPSVAWRTYAPFNSG